MKRAVGKVNPKVEGFEASCFDGLYITGDISDSEEVTALNEGRERGGGRTTKTRRACRCPMRRRHDRRMMPPLSKR